MSSPGSATMVQALENAVWPVRPISQESTSVTRVPGRPLRLALNVWLIATTVLLTGLVPCLWVAMRGSIVSALAALELASTITTLALLMTAQGLRRDPFVDLALVSAILSFTGALTFVRFLERWV